MENRQNLQFGFGDWNVLVYDLTRIKVAVKAEVAVAYEGVVEGG